MSFLVVLMALIINHYWTRERDVLNDVWFIRCQHWLDGRTGLLPEPIAKARWLYPALILVFPCLLLAVLLVLFEGVAFGLLSMAIHIIVLLALFDRINVNAFTRRYLALWSAGNFQSAFILLQERWHQLSLDSCDDQRSLHDEFCRFLVSSFFERIFAIVFWYLLLGPVGALFYHLCVLYLSRVWRHNEDGDETILLRLVYLLEWVPARVLALTFSLAGDFVAAFKRLRETALDMDRSAVSIVYACALSAIEAGRRVLVVRADDTAKDTSESSTLLIEPDEGDDQLAQLRCEQQVQELLGLLNRSQVIWVIALALLTVAGFGM
jgi:AmpE protein